VLHAIYIGIDYSVFQSYIDRTSQVLKIKKKEKESHKDKKNLDCDLLKVKKITYCSVCTIYIKETFCLLIDYKISGQLPEFEKK